MTSCAVRGCDRPIYLAGRCCGHYTKKAKAGLTAKIPIAVVANHVRQLNAAGWTNRDIHNASGVAEDTLRCLLGGTTRGRTTRRAVQRDTAARILALQPTTTRSGRRVVVPATGVRRRAQALARIGWSLRDQSRRCGLSDDTLAHVCARPSGTVSLQTHNLVCALYDQLSATPGPSKAAATKARHKQWPPPMAWWDDDLDNPNAKPVGSRSPACTADGCDKEARSHKARYCATHDHQARKQTFPRCRVPNCEKKSRTRHGGICYQHEVEGEAA